MNLKHLTDKTLISETDFLVQNERELLAKVLHHLKEIDRRRLFSSVHHRTSRHFQIDRFGIN